LHQTLFDKLSGSQTHFADWQTGAFKSGSAEGAKVNPVGHPPVPMLESTPENKLNALHIKLESAL
jgi:hypothetical protein